MNMTETRKAVHTSSRGLWGWLEVNIERLRIAGEALEARAIVDNSDTSMDDGFVNLGVLISKRLLW